MNLDVREMWTLFITLKSINIGTMANTGYLELDVHDISFLDIQKNKIWNFENNVFERECKICKYILN